MKKLITLLLVALIAVTACFSFAGCSKEEGESYKFGKELLRYDSQLDTLAKLAANDIDVSIIDSVMAGYYAKTGDYANQIAIVDDLILAQEKYGIAGRKNDKAFVSKINEALIALADSEYETIGSAYGLEESLCLENDTVNPLASADDNSWNEIVSSGKIVIGYTIFAPICYDIVDEVPTKGFDIELAKAVVAYLNAKYKVTLQVEFLLIDWDNKEVDLAQKNIDLIWNGLTITNERAANMCISVPYLNNNQVAVVLKSNLSKYSDAAKILVNMNSAIIGVEKGSAGESVVLK